MELLPEEIDRISDELAIGFCALPERCSGFGIRKWVNGAFTFTPDGNPLVGPVPGLRNYWAACGCMSGFSQGGAIGLVLANWMVEGDPGADIFGMDVARYGSFASNDKYLRDMTAQFYARRFVIAYPNEELPAGRPLKMTPSYDAQRGRRCALRRGLGHGDAAVFRAGQAGLRRGALAPALECATASSRRRLPRRALRPGCSTPASTAATRCPGRAPKRGSNACSPTGCRPSASSARADARAVGQTHGRSDCRAARTGAVLAGGLLSSAAVAPAVVPRPSAGLRRRNRESVRKLARLLALGSAVARHPRPAHPRGCRRCGVAVSRLSAARHRTHAGLVVARLSLTGELGYEITRAGERSSAPCAMRCSSTARRSA